MRGNEGWKLVYSFEGNSMSSIDAFIKYKKSLKLYPLTQGWNSVLVSESTYKFKCVCNKERRVFCIRIYKKFLKFKE